MVIPLTPDYHRFHFPVEGEVMNVTRISGTYFTVNPMAVRTPVDVYTENVRTVTLIESPDFGKVVMVCVGAMMVGSIVMTKESGHVSR